MHFTIPYWSIDLYIVGKGLLMGAVGVWVIWQIAKLSGLWRPKHAWHVTYSARAISDGDTAFFMIYTELHPVIWIQEYQKKNKNVKYALIRYDQNKIYNRFLPAK
jgi:hypothetical protein